MASSGTLNNCKSDGNSHDRRSCEAVRPDRLRRHRGVGCLESARLRTDRIQGKLAGQGIWRSRFLYAGRWQNRQPRQKRDSGKCSGVCQWFWRPSQPAGDPGRQRLRFSRSKGVAGQTSDLMLLCAARFSPPAPKASPKAFLDAFPHVPTGSTVRE